MRILLIQPGLSEGIGFPLVASPEPLHLEMIAATVPEHEVRILDKTELREETFGLTDLGRLW